MKTFKQFLIEKEKNPFEEIKSDLQDTPGMSIGKRMVSRGVGAVNTAAGKAVSPLVGAAQGDVLSTMFALGRNASPIGLAHTVLTLGNDAEAAPPMMEPEVEEQKKKDSLLASAMNPQDNPVASKAPVELKRDEFRRKEEERQALSDVGTDFKGTKTAGRGSAGSGGMTPTRI